MNKPTDEQVKEFWEKCGFKWVNKPTYFHGYMMHGGVQKDGYWKYPKEAGKNSHLPPIDLNNLFKYAVPKSKFDTLWIINNLDSPVPSIDYCAGFSRGKVNDVVCWSKELPIEECLSPIDKDPALALFWAIYEVIK